MAPPAILDSHQLANDKLECLDPLKQVYTYSIPTSAHEPEAESAPQQAFIVDTCQGYSCTTVGSYEQLCLFCETPLNKISGKGNDVNMTLPCYHRLWPASRSLPYSDEEYS